MTYAIFATGGRQFKAEPGVTIKVPLLAAEPGSKVTAEVVRHAKGKKIRIYRFARRTGYRRHAGHRQQFTEIKIADVKLKD